MCCFLVLYCNTCAGSLSICSIYRYAGYPVLTLRLALARNFTLSLRAP